MLIIIVTLSVIFIFLFFYLLIDKITTDKRLKQNQKEWDEYSKNMTSDEKFREYLPFCFSQKAKYGWGYYYLPKMKGEK